jgi:signal transduction histidine kinase
VEINPGLLSKIDVGQLYKSAYLLYLLTLLRMGNRTSFLTNLAFIAGALALMFLSFFSYRRINSQVRASDDVSKTQLLKFKLNDAFSHLLKTETSQQGFILTGDSSFLYDYFLAQEPIPELLSDIKGLVTSNEEQKSNLTSVKSLFHTRLGYLRRTVTIHSTMSRWELDSIMVRGKRMSDELSGRIEHMISTENLLLGQRMVAKQKEQRYTSVVILLFSLFSIGVLVLGFVRVKKEILNNSVLQEMVNERTGEINQANQALSKQNEELKHKNDELSSFIYIANHDLKEPLRKIELFTTRIQSSSDPLSLENRILLSKTIESVKRMNDLLGDIFIYTLTDRESQFEITDLNKVAETSVNSLRELISTTGAKIEYANLPTIKVVPLQMEQLFTNLLSNSIKYSKKDVSPHIKIEAERQNTPLQQGSWKISFTDNGIGFDQVHKEKIFQMFQRLHPQHEYEGTGIGLTICKKIVENHKGTITAASRYRQGAVFTVVLPDRW